MSRVVESLIQPYSRRAVNRVWNSFTSETCKEWYRKYVVVVMVAMFIMWISVGNGVGGSDGDGDGTGSMSRWWWWRCL